MKSWIINGSQVTLTEAGVASSPAKIIPSDSVLLVVRSGVLKHSIPVAINRVPVTLNQDMKALLCGNEVLPDYLARYIAAKSSEILTWVRATTADNYSIDKLREMRIPLPPLARQAEVVAVLDRVDELRAKRRQSIALLDDLAQSIFLDMFGDPTMPAQGMEIVDFSTVLTESPRNGLSPSKGGSVEACVLTLSCITGSAFDGSFRKISTFNAKPPVRQSIDERDLLICRGNGNINLVGRGYFPDRSDPDVTFPDTIIAARIDQSRVNRQYLEFIWQDRATRTQIEAGARTTNGTFKINQGLIGSIRIPLPPMGEQEIFAQRIDTIRRSRQAYRNQLEGLDELFSSTQSRAFNGDLWKDDVKHQEGE